MTAIRQEGLCPTLNQLPLDLGLPAPTTVDFSRLRHSSPANLGSALRNPCFARERREQDLAWRVATFSWDLIWFLCFDGPLLVFHDCHINYTSQVV